MFRFLSRYWALPMALALGMEALLAVAAVRLGFALRFWGEPERLPRNWALAAVAFAGAVLLSFYVQGLYDSEEGCRGKRLRLRLAKAFGLATVALWVVYYAYPALSVGRGVYAISVIAAALLIAGWRALLCSAFDGELFCRRVLIVGSDAGAIQIAKHILARRHLGYRVVGFLDDDAALQGVSLVNPRVLGTTSQAAALARAHGVSEIVVAQGDNRGRLDLDSLLDCKTAGVAVQESTAFLEKLTGRIRLDSLRRSSLVFSDGFVISGYTVVVKRMLDLVVTSIALIFAAPLMLLVAGAILVDSGRPVLFKQERVGRRGRIFTLLKFRSMRNGAEAPGEARWAAANDGRTTRVGRIIRRARLDELPQLFNVLRGDMSLVGPRPEREPFARELERLCPLYRHRLAVRPGLTGWAQIRAPYAASLEESLEKLEYDLYYIKNLSLWLDLSILASTARTVLLGRGSR